MNVVKEELYKYKNVKQQEFLSKLVPTIDKSLILGVKNPEVRQVAKKMYKENEIACLEFIKELPHKYLEEYILHTSILEQIKDYDFVVKEIEKVLPYIDNWATCDTYSPKIVKKHLKSFYKYIEKWIKSKKTYTVRFGIEMYMSFYLDFEKNKFDKLIDKKEQYTNIDEKIEDTIKMIEEISKIRFKSKYIYKKESKDECPDKYYVDMMIAWFFATLLAKNYDLGIKYIKEEKLETWTHNMTIRKAIESYRITDEQKKELYDFKKHI